MMRRTNPSRWHVKQLQLQALQGKHNNVCEQPYYLKPVAENPYLGTVHDGVSTEYQQGYSVKPIHHLYRFTHNFLPLNIPRGGNRGATHKRLHWLEMTSMYRFKIEYAGPEALPCLWLCVLILGMTTVHLLRVAFYHPDITWYNLAFPTNKNFVPFVRYNEKQQLDQPVYRYFQQQTEFYFKDAMKREMMALDRIVNDPYINHVKEIGRGDELLLDASNRKVDLKPAVFEEKSSWWTPTEERLKTEPDEAFAQTYGSSTFWSLYSNLYRL